PETPELAVGLLDPYLLVLQFLRYRTSNKLKQIKMIFFIINLHGFFVVSSNNTNCLRVCITSLASIDADDY
ncbi:hypothetical protein ACWGMM_08270, partial [Bacillus subtilis]